MNEQDTKKNINKKSEEERKKKLQDITMTFFDGQ